MKTLFLLHGAIGAAGQMQPLAEILSENYNVHSLCFTGHGGQPFSEEPFSIALFAQDVLNKMSELNLQQIDIFGYSMGGYVAAYLAKNHPEKVNRIITLATKFHWDEAIAAKEVQMVNADKIAQKVPAFADVLEKRHAPNDWKMVLEHTATMMHSLGMNNPLSVPDYSAIETPCLIMLGDRDKMVTLDETIAVYRSLPNAQMAMLPATGHPIEQVDVTLLADHIVRFIGK